MTHGPNANQAVPATGSNTAFKGLDLRSSEALCEDSRRDEVDARQMRLRRALLLAKRAPYAMPPACLEALAPAGLCLYGGILAEARKMNRVVGRLLRSRPVV